MVIASSLVYICLVVFSASCLVKNFEPDVERSSLLDSCMVWGVLASSLFFLPFHFLGFVNLALGYPVVDPGYACVVVCRHAQAFRSSSALRKLALARNLRSSQAR